jgi:hypothetical protein
VDKKNRGQSGLPLADELRREAERRLRENEIAAVGLAPTTDRDALIRELELRQIELQMPKGR